MDNPFFNAEFAGYLEANGFLPGSQSAYSNTLYFFKNNIGVMICGDSVDFGLFDIDHHGRKPGCNRYASFTGVSNLDLFGWMLLMHITGTVPLKEFIKKGKAEEKAIAEYPTNARHCSPMYIVDSKFAL